MPARLEAGRGTVRMLRILKGSSPQQETKTQPQKELLPQQMVPSKVQKSLVLGSVRFQTLSLLHPTPNSSPGPLLLPTRNTLSSQSYLETQSCLISNWGALERHAVGAKLTHFYSKVNLEVESGAMHKVSIWGDEKCSDCTTLSVRSAGTVHFTMVTFMGILPPLKKQQQSSPKKE